MAEDTNIEWADDTVNPWWGCTKVSPACAHCYAETLDGRFRMGGETHWGPGAPRFIRVDKAIGELEKLARRSDKEGRPRRVFIASMADVFEDRPDLIEPRKKLWDALHRLAGDAPRITPLLLTKRPDVMAAWAAEHGWPAGCWAGTTVEDQRRADERIPHLLRVPAGVRFLSCEPLLGPVRIDRLLPEPCEQGCGEDVTNNALTSTTTCGCCVEGPESITWGSLHWVIAGGESGPRARPSHPDWARSLRDQCEAAGVAFHFKQWGAWKPICQMKESEHDPLYTSRRKARHWENQAVIDEMEGRVCSVPHLVLHADGTHAELGDPHAFAGPGPVSAFKIGKKATGRVLDGRTHDGVPHA